MKKFFLFFLLIIAIPLHSSKRTGKIPANPHFSQKENYDKEALALPKSTSIDPITQEKIRLAQTAEYIGSYAFETQEEATQFQVALSTIALEMETYLREQSITTADELVTCIESALKKMENLIKDHFNVSEIIPLDLIFKKNPERVTLSLNEIHASAVYAALHFAMENMITTLYS